MSKSQKTAPKYTDKQLIDFLESIPCQLDFIAVDHSPKGKTGRAWLSQRPEGNAAKLERIQPTGARVYRRSAQTPYHPARTRHANLGSWRGTHSKNRTAMNKKLKAFINEELPRTNSERLEKCLTWFIQNHRDAATVFKLLAKEGKDTMQIYRTLKAEGALIGFTTEIEKHKTLLAAIEYCVRRHTQDKLESN